MRAKACRWTVELTKADRLLSGQNQLIAFARNSRRNIKLARVTFSYYHGRDLGCQPITRPPPSGSPSMQVALSRGFL